MQDFEKLGAFYLGKAYDLQQRQLKDELLLYDSKDLTTHAMCVGMTGSGKTGLCLALLEEAAIDGIPAIIIDPKGDLANLALTFPELKPTSFRPWIDESAATRAGMTGDQFAAETAERWREGLAEWGQDPSRIQRFRDAVDIPIYTPGSNAGLPLTVLRSFNAPADEFMDDADAYRDRVSSAASGLLALLGIKADPVRSREHILISCLLDRAWREHRDLDIASLIQEIQRPPIKKVGVVDLEMFFPEKDRVDLAMSLNNLLASPSFASWMEGEPLDIDRLLYTAEGKPRLAIISIAHLSDDERMFFVTILLNEVVTWMRSQAGTSSLRAMLYMDEVFGYFPPTANPPSKKPMLTLLKQARAFGLGVVLATQNPVDLDYKGLSNMGTWFLGRLQTERDKARVLEGLEGAAAQSGSTFDRGKMEQTLASLGSRVFLMNNVHEDEPIVFQTRWVLSYLRGPLTSSQIKKLMKQRKAAAPETAAAASGISPRSKKEMVPDTEPADAQRPMLPAEVEEQYIAPARPLPDGYRLTYRPALLGRAKLHFSRATYKIDTWQERTLLAVLSPQDVSSPWEDAALLDRQAVRLDQRSEPEAQFATAPVELTRAKSFSSWQKQLKDFCYRTQRLPIWHCAQLKLYSNANESEPQFRVRLTQLAREKRDLEMEKLRKRFASKFATLQDRIRSAEERVRREEGQYRKASFDSVISVGSSLLESLFGRKLASATNVRRAGTSMRSVSSAAGQRGDIHEAKEKLESYQQQLEELEQQLEEETHKVEESYQPNALQLESVPVKPLKSDIQVEQLSVAWTPWHVDASGLAEPAFDAMSEESE